jgi:hypothetical protein
MPHLEMSHYLSPKKNLTDEQLVIINRIRSKFLDLCKELEQDVHVNPARDKAFDLMLEAVEQLETAVQRPSCLTPDSLLVAFASKEAQDKRVTDLWMCATHYADIRKYGRDVFEIESDSEQLKQGIMGKLWGAKVQVSRLIPKYTFVIVGAGEENLAQGQAPSESQLTRF